MAALALLLAACDEGGSGASPASPAGVATPSVVPGCTPSRPQPAGDRAATSPGGDRTWVIHVPAGYSGAEAAPLVFGFTGLDLPAENFAALSDLPALSDEHGFVLVMLNPASEGGRWNARNDAGGPDDVGFVGAMLTEFSAQYCIDETRVYLAGFSDGGGMAQAAACASADRIAALAVVASVFQACRASVPAIAFHGSDDRIAPIEGGTTSIDAGAVAFPSVRRSMTEWARGLGCDALPVISRPSPEVELSTFKRCLGGDGDALLYSVIGGGHTWPGSPVEIAQLGFTTQQLDASQVLWAFFEAHAIAVR